MISDRFRSLDHLEPPDRWEEVLVRSGCLDVADAAHLGSASAWQAARPRAVAAAAAVIVLVLISVAAFGLDGDGRDTLRADQPGDPEPTTEPATTPPGSTASSTTQTTSSTPSTTTGPGTTALQSETPPPSSPPPTTAPAPTTTRPSAPPGTWPAFAPPYVAPGRDKQIGGPCPMYTGISLINLRSGPSPRWSPAAAVLGDGTGPAPDGSWPPHALAHGEIEGVANPGSTITFEIGMGFGLFFDRPAPYADLTTSLTTPTRDESMGHGEWPGVGYPSDPTTPAPGVPPERQIHLPPAPSGLFVRVVVLAGGFHPDHACNGVYIAIASDSPHYASPESLDFILEALAENLWAGPPP